MSGTGVHWDAFQAEALVEMGLRPYRLAPVQVAVPKGVPPALFEALQRAAGGRAEVATLPGLADLHGDATAKRRLWPLLRRMRASG